jgi:hypothetical protein
MLRGVWGVGRPRGLQQFAHTSTDKSSVQSLQRAVVSQWSPFLPLVTRDGGVKPGVFGLPNVRTPADLLLVARTAVQRWAAR